MKLNESGFGLAGVLVSIGVLAIASYLLMTGYSVIFNSKRRVGSQLSAFSVRARLMSALGSTEGMAKTIQNNPAMANCYKPTGCAALRNSLPISINVFDADGTQLTNFSNASAGFTASGGSCNGFSSGGNDSCPFRYNVTWQPLCDSASANCLNPQSKIVATFNYKGTQANSSPEFESNKMNFLIYPSVELGSAQDQCRAVGGSPTSSGCTMHMYNTQCSKGWVVTAVDNSVTPGSITCELIIKGRCADGWVAYGIDSAGNVSCRPKGYCPTKKNGAPGNTKWQDWQYQPAGGDGGDGGDGCDGADGSDGCS